MKGEGEKREGDRDREREHIPKKSKTFCLLCLSLVIMVLWSSLPATVLSGEIIKET